MKYIQGKYQVIENKALARDIFSIVILCPEIAEIAVPGQFVHILPESQTLRRPISICDTDKNAGTLRIVFIVKGEGTKKISQAREGTLIDMLAPLGNGFTIDSSADNVVLIGGGIGTPPLLPLAKQYGQKATVITGFRSANAVILQEDFKSTGANTIVCTDDGSTGVHGVVTTPLQEVLSSKKVDLICACGPTPMLKAIVKLAEEYNIPCQISLEERMGCGIGACLVCACKTKRENGQEHYAHVCKDGPVFNAKEVIW